MVIYLKTIKENINNELIIKNSRFITYLFKIVNVLEVSKILEEIKTLHPKATHHCYAYIIGDYQKSSDDNEPASTAGMPMLNVLLKNDLNNILAITVRYFGGIKLGAGGLVRAYSSSVSKALEHADIIELKEAVKLLVKLDYSRQKNFEYLIKDKTIISKNFDQDITYTLLIEKDSLNILEHYDYEILDNNCYIEKE